MRALLVVGAAILCCGCSTWRAQGLTPEAVVVREDPNVLRVAPAGGEPIEFASPRVEGDSLVGKVHGRRAAIALDSIERVEARRGSQAWMLVVPILFALGIGLAAAAASVAAWGPSGGDW